MRMTTQFSRQASWPVLPLVLGRMARQLSLQLLVPLSSSFLQPPLLIENVGVPTPGLHQLF